METGLVAQDDDIGSMIARPDNAGEAGEMANARTFYGMLKLYASSTNEVKNEKIPMNHYGYKPEKDKLESLGKEVAIIPLTWRFAATEFVLDVKTQKHIFKSYYDKHAPEFIQIQERSKSKDEKTRKGNSCGFDFLVWVPSVGKLMRVQLVNATNCKIQPKLDGWLGKGVVLSSRRIEANGYIWQGMTARPYEGEALIRPPADETRTAVAEFVSAKFETNEKDADDEDTETVSETEATHRG